MENSTAESPRPRRAEYTQGSCAPRAWASAFAARPIAAFPARKIPGSRSSPQCPHPLPLTQNLRRAEETLRALLRGDSLPCVKVFVGVFDCLPGHLRRGTLENANHFRRPRRVRGLPLFLRDHLLPVKPHRIFAPKL